MSAPPSRGAISFLVGGICSAGAGLRVSLMSMTRRFREAMRLMRSHDPQRREDGFHQLLPHAADHIGELIAQFEQEQDDHGLRCWLLELIGAARSPGALPVLGAQLDGNDESLRDRAVAGLEKLGTPEARALLWHARANGTIA
ncbi:MAG TPA: HEAT repeat domain-containing protein [Trebonia sp.]